MNRFRKTVSRLSFEQLCKDHITQIKQRLGISGFLSEESVWYTLGNQDLGISGAQIDLVIDRRDRVINLCEMKFSMNEFTIDKDYDLNLRNKLDSFLRMTGTKKSLQLTLITTFGIKQEKYSGMIRSQVLPDDLFQKVIYC